MIIEKMHIRPTPQCACSLGYILSNYVTPLMQCLTNDIKEFNMQLLTTKCLNTAVMVLFFFLGSKARSRANVCDSHKLRNDFLSGKVHTLDRLDSLKKQLMKYSKNRYVFFVMINDGDLIKEKSTIYFPGHVFVIEKYPLGEKKNGYNIYQSYINQYDLKGYLNKVGNSFEYSSEQMKRLLHDLHMLFTKPVWDQECVRFWSDFTAVDSSEFIGAQHNKVLSLCYTRDKLTHCLEKINKYTKTKLKDLHAIADKTAIYGNKDSYYYKDKAITVSDMEKTLQSILQDIEQTKLAH